MNQKIIRDPVYDYISIDRDEDGWLLDLIDTPEVQRLRLVRQLGVSSLTYPGATHTRFSHSLGVLHLMQRMLEHLDTYIAGREDAELVRKSLLAAAVLHDVGHGPYSHVFDRRLTENHEVWTTKIITASNKPANLVLKKEGILERVVSVISKEDFSLPYWQKSLISSQLDVDRMDYLLRDSHFLGTGYGKFDWYRIINTMEILGFMRTGHPAHDYPVWPDKTKFAIEEYIFARFYMYQSVYFHHCTRAFEKMLHAIWDRAEELYRNGCELLVFDPVKPFLQEEAPTVDNYLCLRECHILSQLLEWRNSRDQILSELCARFIDRKGFGWIEIAIEEDPFAGYELAARREAAASHLRDRCGIEGSERYFLLEDRGTLGIYEPYWPEPAEAEQEPMTAIFLGGFREISSELKRLQAITREKNPFMRFYCPKEYREEVGKILRSE